MGLASIVTLVGSGAPESHCFLNPAASLLRGWPPPPAATCSGRGGGFILIVFENMTSIYS